MFECKMMQNADSNMNSFLQSNINRLKKTEYESWPPSLYASFDSQAHKSLSFCEKC
ncbi:hypothetical protein C1H46_002182 [Malus baccata]|uniref:Uncharacterized protein n=1 Tax=Malus baccata TaxID=106549 RepID=A0A540NMK9_MALBA|nr:hypothetical protein C1H46_002182 [Malus baccata]